LNNTNFSRCLSIRGKITKRDGAKIHLKAKQPFSTDSISSNRLNSILNLSLTLADNVTTGLAGLLLHDYYKKDTIQLSFIDKILESENIDLRTYLKIKLLRKFNLGTLENYKNNEVINILTRLIEDSQISMPIYELEYIFLIDLIKSARLSGAVKCLEDIYKKLLKRIENDEAIYNLPLELIIEMYRLTKEFYDSNNFKKICQQVKYMTELEEEELKKDVSTYLNIKKFKKIFSNENEKKYTNKKYPLGIIYETIKLSNEFDETIGLGLINKVCNDIADGRQIPYGIIIEMIQLAQKFEYVKALKLIYKKCSEELIFEAVPYKLLIETINLARMFGDKKVLEYIHRERITDILHYDYPDEVLLEKIKLAQEFKDKRVLRDLIRKRYLPPKYPKKLCINIIIEMIKLARKVNAKRIPKLFHSYIPIIHEEISSMPVGVLDDILWFAKAINNNTLIKKVTSLVE
jgi:hypothetical protein